MRTIVQNWRLGYSPEEIVEALPHLTLAQVFEAMSHYYENHSEIETLSDNHRIPDELIGTSKRFA